MRRSDKEVKDINVIEEILKEAEIIRIALCDAGQPYIVPMNFGYDKGVLYLHSAKEGRKIDIIRKNNKICFEVDVKTEVVKKELICNYGMKYFSIIGEGTAELLTNLEDKKLGLDIIAEKYAEGSNIQYPEAALNNIEVIKVTVSSMTGKKSGY